jgi:hypothetical protein
MADTHPTRVRCQNGIKRTASTWSNEDDLLLASLVSSVSKPDWEIIARQFPNKTPQQVSDRWNKVANPELIKGSWTDQEDRQIEAWVQGHGPKSWTALAATMHGRLGKQCRERWVNSLDPDLARRPWTEEEDTILIEHQTKWGNKWAKIASLLQGRTDNCVKNRWNSSLKRRLERIAAGQNPVLKRGRKPKRPSTAPSLPIDDVPKPDFGSIPVSTQTQTVLSPSVQLSQILFGALSPGGLGFRSPYFGSCFRSPLSPFSLKSPLDLKGGTFTFDAGGVPFQIGSDLPEKE